MNWRVFFACLGIAAACVLYLLFDMLTTPPYKHKKSNRVWGCVCLVGAVLMAITSISYAFGSC